MLKKKIIGVLVIGSLFVACTSIVDMTIPLSKSFQKESRVISLTSPTWRLKDSVYNKRLGEYFIANSKTTGERLKDELIDRKRVGNFINYLLFNHDIYSIVSEFKREGNQRFSFELKRGSALKATSKCEILTKSSFTRKRSITQSSDESHSGSDLTTREKTFLVCSISVGTQHWGLTLKSNKHEPMVVKLNSTNSAYMVKDVSGHQDVLSNGERRDVPSYLSPNSGLEFYKNNQQVAALSFLKNPKIWIKEGLSTEEEVLLLSANYSLTMFNWIDGEWK